MDHVDIILDDRDLPIPDAPLVPIDDLPPIPTFQERKEDKYQEILDEIDRLAINLNLSPAGKLLRKYILAEGFGDHHIEVYDNWISHSSYNNVYGRTLLLPGDRVVCFENLNIFPPRYTKDGKVLVLTPKLAREQGITYGGDWHVDVVVRKGNNKGEIIERKDGFCIGTVPTMLKSRKCILHGKSRTELALLGEDPTDPGGYFIVSGVEKVVLLQERLVVNKIFLMDMGGKNSVVARLTANTIRGTALIELALDKKTRSIIKMRFPSMREQKKRDKNDSSKANKYKSINVLRVFRLLGLMTVDEIKSFISLFIRPERIKKCMLKLTRNFVDFIVLPDDVSIILDKMDKSNLSDIEKKAEIDRILQTDLFPHLNEFQGQDGEFQSQRNERIMEAKRHLLGIMVARFVEHIAGYRDLDNRDDWGNKRTDGAGRMMEQLFRNAWRKLIGTVRASIEVSGVKDLHGVLTNLRYNVITDTFHDSFITNKWGVRGTQTKDNVAVTLVRDSLIATYAHINTVDVSISRTVRKQSLRLVQNSQYGLICPVSTPEGENAGLVKNLSISAKVSLERTGEDIIRYLIGDEKKGIKPQVSMKQGERNAWKDHILVDGKPLGWCDADNVQRMLIDMRRKGALPADMSVVREDDWLYVDISPSRLVRPLLIVDDQQRLVIDILGAREAPNHILLTNGSMEYISAWEGQYIKLATSIDDITKRLSRIEDAEEAYRAAVANLELILSQEYSPEYINQPELFATARKEAQREVNTAKQDLTTASSSRPYTHCEIDPLAILGVAAASIPWPNHNQAPRNTYQVAMFKQSLGDYHSNHLNRFDGKMKVLTFSTRPMVETEMYDIIGLTTKGTGENLNIAFLAAPDTEEDAFVMKKEFLDNGGFRIHKYLTYKTIVKHHSGEVTEELTRPELQVNEQPTRYDAIQMYEKNNPNNGLPKLGAYRNQGDCIIGKIQHIPSVGEHRNESVILRVGDEGIVEKVLVTSDSKTTTVTVKLRIMRVPQEGDKFAPRNAQKGTVGIVMSDIDMVSDEHGIVPDMYINPHAIPSRMTQSYIMEIISAKVGATKGTHINGGPFKPFPLNEYRKVLRERNRKLLGEDLRREHEFGYEFMRSGTSGNKMEVPIYSGLVFFQALKHHVKDKVQARGTGQFKPMTRQPAKGRGNRGGLRFGEMERDSAIAHGASAFTMERLMYTSDAYQVPLCRICGQFGVNDAKTKRYKPCRLCGNVDTFGRTTIPYVLKLLIHLLAAPGMNLSPETLTSDEYLERLLNKGEHLPSEDISNIREELEEIDMGFVEEQDMLNMQDEQEAREAYYRDY